MKVLASEVVPQTQPTPCSCTATCIAMALGIPVQDLGVRLDSAFNFDDFGVFLANRGVWMRVADRGERFRAGRLYLVGARSLNLVGSDHSLLLDTRADHSISYFNEDREAWKTYDPNAGRDGKKLYHFIDEYWAIDFCELKDEVWSLLAPKKQAELPV